MYRPEAPLIIQSDGSVLLEIHAAEAELARDALARFAELVKSPEHVHTYRITSLSLWNAAGAGLGEADILGALARFAKYDLPGNVTSEIREAISRFGRLVLTKDTASGDLRLRAADDSAARQIAASRRWTGMIGARDGLTFVVPAQARGALKQALVHSGWPVRDDAGFAEGLALDVAFRSPTLSGRPFQVRPYQEEAARSFLAGGHGVIVLPCGAGKTVVAMVVMTNLQTRTLILCTSTSAVHQWRRELIDKTTLTDADIGEYTAASKNIRPVTITTYSMLVRKASGGFPHMGVVDRGDWGLIVYDEVHLLPAPLLRMTADLQARRRLGLTATLVREDGKEGDVFSLIGPKRYDVPWREMEAAGWVARASCIEVRLPMATELRVAAAVAERSAVAYRLAAENPAKLLALRHLVGLHAKDRILVVGQFRNQVQRAAALLGAPLVTGETSDLERERLYSAFRAGVHPVLVASKVANFSIDLPDANVLIQLSGAYGSRQEEAQRLGRILRPKERPATFYTLVSRESDEQRFAFNRQLFLAEQGYHYSIEDWEPTAGCESETLALPAGDALSEADEPDELPALPEPGLPN
jgi:DNA excision repair protein ERCC-3